MVQKMKYFIITVDTEGDDLWNWDEDQTITTNNAECLERFQNLCEQYNFPPVYLINYEMALSEILVQILNAHPKDKFEIGMHLHAWNSPPTYTLNKMYSGNPYITEYPVEVIREKHIQLRNLIEERFHTSPISYRAGRWATNNDLFSVISELGFLVDCSVTPQLTHAHLPGSSVPGGCDYTKSPIKPYMITDTLMEVPMTTRHHKTIKGNSLKNRIRNTIKGRTLWMRPAVQTYSEMVELAERSEREGVDYIEFMIHSSELLAAGSPYCKTDTDVENFYKKIKQMFEWVKANKYEGCTLAEYYKTHFGSLISSGE
jgi:hypothetical protein